MYNSSETEAKEEYVLLDPAINQDNEWMYPVFGIEKKVKILSGEDENSAPIRYVKFHLEPMQFLILKNY